MRLMYALRFSTGDRWGEIVHKHTVCVTQNFSAACGALTRLTNAATSLMVRLVPNEKERHNAYLNSTDINFKMDPEFQVIDGYWHYYLEPVIEYDVTEIIDLTRHHYAAKQLEGRGWARIHEFKELSKKNPQVDGEKLVPAAEPQVGSLGALLKRALEQKMAA